MNTSSAHRPSPAFARLLAAVAATVVVLVCVGPAAGAVTADAQGATAVHVRAVQARQIAAMTRAFMAQNGLRSAIVSVRKDGHNVLTRAFGESAAGQPATTRMSFRNGAIAVSYLSTELLRMVDRHQLSLSDKLSRWFPDLPDARHITLRMLAASRSGYADFVTDPTFASESEAHPYRSWKPWQLIHIGTTLPRLYPAGAGWNYAHTNFVTLGRVLQKASGIPLGELLRRDVLRPMGLNHTVINCGPAIVHPILHAFTNERGAYEESTFWNPSWTLGCGQVMTTTIRDVIRSAAAIGNGALLTHKSHELQIAPRSRITPPGFTPGVFYSLGLFSTSNGWIFQNPLFSGYQAIMGDLPHDHLAIAITTTIGPNANSLTNYSTALFTQIGTYLAPNNPPPPS